MSMMETESGNSTTLMEPKIVLFLYYGDSYWLMSFAVEDARVLILEE
jgi:hypothetical protein